MALLLQGADAILRDVDGIQEQRHVALLQGSEMPAVFTTRV